MAGNDKKKLQEEKKRQRANSEPAAQPQNETQGETGDQGETPEISPIAPVDTEEQRRLLEQQQEAARRAAEERIDYTVEQGAEALRRAEEDAQAGFQSERDRIDIEERQALDSQALYAEMRGDRGGIGQAQYASIQNTAAVNRRQVNLEQQRLATETARQIEDLRRQGEFQKADELLQLTQQYLSELLELERWAKERDLSIEQFNIELARWKAEFAWQVKRFGIETELKLAGTSGKSGGSGGYSARQKERAKIAELARWLKEKGLALTSELAEALGWSEGEYEAFIEATEEGEGVPFQLMESWMAALARAEDKQAVYQSIRASDWYAKMSAEQRQRLEEAMK